MVSIPVAFILSLVTALAATPLVRGIARRVGAMDLPERSFRKIHRTSVPRLGGLAIFVAFYAPLIGLLVVDSGMGYLFTRDISKALGLLLGGLPIVVLGAYDDVVGARATQKFIVQFGVAFALYALGFRISAVSTPFGFTVHLGWMGFPLTCIWIVGLINAMNLIDGLDGLASGVAFFAAATTLAVAWVRGDALMMLFMASLTGSVLGFLVFNFNPATIFMGDTGSMFLGYVVGVTALQTNTKGEATVALLTPVLALGIPIMDTLLAMLRRALRAQPMFVGDREHIHHRLLARGLSHRGAVLVIYAASLLFGLMALGASLGKGANITIMLIAAGVVTVVGIRALSKESGEGRKTWAEHRRQNLRLRRLVRDFQSQVKAAATVAELWDALVDAARRADAARLRVEVDGRPTLEWGAPRLAPSNLTLTSELATKSIRGKLAISWHDGRSTLTPGEAIAIDTLLGLFCQGLDAVVAEASHVMLGAGRRSAIRLAADPAAKTEAVAKPGRRASTVSPP